MSDLCKELGNLIVDTINDDWAVVIVKITSSLNKMCVFDCSYSKDKKRFKNFYFDDMEGFLMGKKVFELQESMQPERKWNRAVYTLQKNGHFDMTFEWEQALQDKWDKN